MKQKIRLIIGSLSIILLLWVSYQISLRQAQYLPQPYRQWLSLANFKFKAAAANLVDAVYLPTYWHGDYSRKLPVFNLLMSAADITNLKSDARQSVEWGYNAKQAANTQQVALLFEGKQ